KDLKQAQVDGILIDLRRNGGGSLQEAIELSGLFIKQGPVVQVKNSRGGIRVENDPDPALVYDGPLAVVVDRFSASASEIFAAAIQDYGRGIIIGSRTFGKGTVQNLLDLNKFVSGSRGTFGQMKVTIAKFYRINGGTTQHRGVIPDIHFPSIYDEMDFGESTQIHALPWDEISAAMFQPEDRVSKYLSTLRLNSKKRTQKDREFQYLIEDIASYKNKRDRNVISLQEAKRKAEREKLEEKRLTRINERRRAKGLKLLKKGDKVPRDEEAPDALLIESQHILADLIALIKSTETAKISID
ncbi:MAG: carboxy terminal-processing peptidase, partial [bacterium]